MSSKTDVLPEWKEFTFTDVVEVNPKRSLKKGEECPYIEMKSILPNHRKVEKVDKRVYKGGGSKFRNDDTIFARITPCLENGKIAFISELDPDQAGYGSTEFIVMSGKEGVTDNLFVYYLSRWDEIRYFAIKNMTGTSGRQRVPNDIFKQKKIHLPPLPEQQKIASILSAFDDKIELNNQMNRTLEEMASALFKSWFVDFEPFREGEFEYNGELEEEIPKGWVIKKLEATSRNFDRERIPLSKMERLKREGRYPYYGAAGIIDYIDDYIFDGEYLLIAEDGSVEQEDDSPTLQLVREKFWVNNHAHILKGVDGISTYFLYQALKRVKIRPYMTGSVQPKLSQKNLQRIPIIVPTSTVLNEFQDLITPMYQQIFANEEENNRIVQIRDVLLPKLLSGEIRVNLSGNNNMFKEAEDVGQ